MILRQSSLVEWKKEELRLSKGFDILTFTGCIQRITSLSKSEVHYEGNSKTGKEDDVQCQYSRQHNVLVFVEFRCIASVHSSQRCVRTNFILMNDLFPGLSRSVALWSDECTVEWCWYDRPEGVGYFRVTNDVHAVPSISAPDKDGALGCGHFSTGGTQLSVALVVGTTDPSFLRLLCIYHLILWQICSVFSTICFYN